LKAALSPTIRVLGLSAHINDESFARAAVDLLMESIGGGGSPRIHAERGALQRSGKELNSDHAL
jgi:hypothetical protein